MITLRTILYVLAPIPIISGSLALSHWAHEDPNRCATRNEVHTTAPLGHVQLGWKIPPARPWATDDLRSRCHGLARQVQSQLGPEDHVIVKSPLVIGGNLTAKELNRWHDETIAPAMAAMQRDLFRVPPQHPITVLLFSDEPTYRDYARRLFGERRVSIYGYYQPTNRTVVINLGAGGGTVIHELTHALIDFDFPDVPLWFNEGLASYHEHCTIELHEEGPDIRPLMNWRLQVLQTAILEGRLMPTWDLMNEEHFRGRHEAVLYAHARYFCFYLHDKGLLKDYYAAFRRDIVDDPTGELTIREFFPGQTWSQIERGFRSWAMEQRIPEFRL